MSLQHPGYYQAELPEVRAVRLAWAVPKIALHCLQAGRVPCELPGFLQEIHPPGAPPPVTFCFLNTGVEQPLFTCLGLS